MKNNGGEHDQLRRQANFSRYYSDGLSYDPNIFAPGAKCPNHGCRLYLTDQIGKGICEISGVYFDYDEGPVKAGDNAKNRAKEFEIKIVNGQYQKVPKTAQGFQRNITKIRR